MSNAGSANSPFVSIHAASCRISSRHHLYIENFQLCAGQHWCVFGGNGTGKTLLARLLLGQLAGGRQHVHYSAGFDPHRDIVTVSFEEQQRLWSLDNRHDISEYTADAQDAGTTVEALIRDGKMQECAQDRYYTELLEQLGLVGLSNRGIRYLSSGQLRKVMIARALFSKTDGKLKLLILDDPLESIDRNTREHIMALLAGWMDAHTCTLLLCRRQSDILPGISHLALLQELKIVAQGDIKAVEESAAFQAMTAGPVLQAPVLPERDQANDKLNSEAVPIVLRNVTVRYGENLVLNSVSWTMQDSHHTLIEGPNGCGKSTLLNLLAGENHKAYGQEVTLFGRLRGTGESVWDVKAHFGIVSNELHSKYCRGWRVLDVVVSGFFDSVGLYDDSGASQIAMARRWLQALGLESLAREYYHEISFGQQRLILLARAMVKFPDVLILDEPCVGLDDYYRQVILETIDAIASRTSTQILYVSHCQGEEPHCINQRIQFVPVATGGFGLDIR
jgi:molybdate transport system ATP-binding protein